MLIPPRYRDLHPGALRRFLLRRRRRGRWARASSCGACARTASEFPVEISLSPLETEDGRFAIAAIRDVTERKRFEQELQDANVQLEEANRAKDRFLASMSHELRTPLNAILGFTGTMLMGLPGPLNDEQAKQLRTVQTSGRHLLSLINDLLDLARIESGKHRAERSSRSSVPSCLRRSLSGCVRSPTRRESELEVVVPAAPLRGSNSDRRALSQILINLANNAIKFTDQRRGSPGAEPAC